jgi:hypothetical protein
MTGGFEKMSFWEGFGADGSAGDQASQDSESMVHLASVRRMLKMVSKPDLRNTLFARLPQAPVQIG